jgi:16S rRNA processing protein RimM
MVFHDPLNTTPQPEMAACNMEADRTSKTFRAGEITSTHGLKGEVRIRPEYAHVPALCAASCYEVRFENGMSTTVEVRRAAVHKHMILAALHGYNSVESVEGFIGAEVWLDPDALPEAVGGNYYWHQLKGLQVVDHEMGEVGILEDILPTPGHDIYVVRGSSGEVMIPAVAAMVERVDPVAGVMYVTLPQGLIELN